MIFQTGGRVTKAGSVSLEPVHHITDWCGVEEVTLHLQAPPYRDGLASAKGRREEPYRTSAVLCWVRATCGFSSTIRRALCAWVCLYSRCASGILCWCGCEDAR